MFAVGVFKKKTLVGFRKNLTCRDQMEPEFERGMEHTEFHLV